MNSLIILIVLFFIFWILLFNLIIFLIDSCVNSAELYPDKVLKTGMFLGGGLSLIICLVIRELNII